jgi:DNA polymerase III alpha subunit
MENLIPVWKSHYSIGRSILTLESSEKSTEDGPDSIIKLCEDNGIKDLFLIDDCMAGFLEGCVNSKAAGINFHFGLRITVCPDINIKNEESLSSSCKYIVLCKNDLGYKRLIKIFTFSKHSIHIFYIRNITGIKRLIKIVTLQKQTNH